MDFSTIRGKNMDQMYVLECKLLSTQWVHLWQKRTLTGNVTVLLLVALQQMEPHTQTSENKQVDG